MGLCLDVPKVDYLAKGFAFDIPDVGRGACPGQG